MKRSLIIFLTILIVFPSAVFAGGGGGMFWQQQAEEYPFAEDWDIAHTNMDLHMFGGFGYGINRDGRISGGYGFAIVSEEGDSGDEVPGAISGGFGGVINGYQVISRPIHLAFVSYAGLGGIYRAADDTRDEQGWFALSLEVDVEVGLPIFGWFMPVIYAGYQYMGAVFPDSTEEAFQTYSPVLGFRMSFGDFQ